MANAVYGPLHQIPILLMKGNEVFLSESFPQRMGRLEMIQGNNPLAVQYRPRRLGMIVGLVNSSLCMLVHVLLHVASTKSLDTKP